ncbi:unnamed protein product [Rhizoctonia solani]|uniref:Uncharacterized protein n=1 Tax=Rhizoctonia solani TaxID=456999 RepID=A0A8H2WU78_9AGAM|nr:unnamed protein product [Rhizoctonia solani]
MGRDRKTSITQEVAKIVFPASRRPSITSSFSLPSLSLSSRSKPTPVLAPLDTSRANSHPLDSGSATCSFITPSVAHPNTLELSHSPSRSISPMKPPSSPGASVPLPSIRSLRSRFSLTTQDPPNLPGVALQTAPQKRVTSRRFLPFGNSASSSQPVTSTPSIPRKSLGDVFAIGRTSTSSRYDSTSSRSVTPSTKSSRSVNSVGTMRGPWSHGSGYSTLAPPHSAASPRPRSDDFTELGYVIAIESGEDTIRGRPDPPPAEPPPRLRDSSQTIIESSRENLSQMTLSPQTEIPSPTLPEFVSSSSQPTPNSNLTNQPNNVVRRRQSPVPPIAIPPPGVPAQLEGTEKTPATLIDLEGEDPDALPSVFPFTPIDDRSDVTSSTNNTPHSGDRSHLPPSVPPPLPSPSPRPENDTQTGFPFLNSLPPLVNPLPGSTGDPSRRRGQIVEPWSAANFNAIPSPTAGVSEKPSASRGHSNSQPPELPRHGASGATVNANATSSLDFGSNPSTKSVLGLAGEQSGSLSHHIPKVKVSNNGILPIDFDPHASYPDRHSYLLSTLGSPTSNGPCPPTASGEDSDLSDMNGAASKNAPAQSSILTQNRPLELASRSVHPSTLPVKDLDQDGRHLNTIEDDLAKLLSPHRFSPLADRPEPRQLQTPASAHVPLPSASLSPQPSPLQRAGTRLPLPGSSPSPSVLSSRVNDLLSAKLSANVQRGAPVERNAVSLNGSPMLSPGKLSSPGSWGTEQANYREIMTTPNNPTRLLPRRSPSVGGVITRKRSASFDSSGSPTTFTRDTSDPFASHSIGSNRTDWLGPRTAKAFAAAGLIEKDRERSGLYSGPRSETPSHRGGSLNSWRTHGERNGGVLGSGAGSVRSHSRLGSEIISPSFRARSLVGGDSSPSYRRSSLDHTAPPSPVSTHRTLVSSATSSSQSQSALQTMRERHELETEALLLALAGSKRTERDLRAENEELTAYIVQLERRIAILEVEKEQAERSQSRAREYRWNTPSPSDVDSLDKRRQEILAGRSSARGWTSSNKSTALGSRSQLYGRPPLSAGLPRSASAASVHRPANEFDRVSPSKTLDTANLRTPPHNPSLTAASTLTKSSVNQSLAEVSTATRDDFDDWSEDSFSQPLQSSPRLEARNRLSSHSVASLVPQMPGNMSMLVHEQPGREFGEDEISFGSTSPSSTTLVHPRSNTPKPTPANISPITADFSFNSIPGSPRSLRLGPEEEMHLADLISLQGLEITDIITSLDA